MKTWGSGLNACCARSARRSLSVGIRPRSVPLRHSINRSMPTTGGNSCASIWCAGPAASSRTITLSRTRRTAGKYLTFDDGSRSYFPVRVPKTVRFDIDEQYSRLFANDVVDDINGLELPRYGLGNYVAPSPHTPPTPAEAKVLDDLSRAGKRLMGFCRTNLFKRLESSGHAFLLSVETAYSPELYLSPRH